MVVKNVDISVNRNEVVGLLGPNGAGKTTTFYMITGMIKPTKGDIFLDDYNIYGISNHKNTVFVHLIDPDCLENEIHKRITNENDWIFI